MSKYELPDLLPAPLDRPLIDVLDRRFVYAPAERMEKVFGFTKSRARYWKSHDLVIFAAGKQITMNRAETMYSRFRNPFTGLIDVKMNGLTLFNFHNCTDVFLENGWIKGLSLVLCLSGITSVCINQWRVDSSDGLRYSVELVICISGAPSDDFSRSRAIELMITKSFANSDAQYAA